MDGLRLPQWLIITKKRIETLIFNNKDAIITNSKLPLLHTSISNGTGQCNFSRQRNRSSFIVPGQRDKLKILPWDRMDRDSLSKSRPVPWQDFELVPLSLCSGTMKKLLSFCLEKLHCPVPLETLV